MLARPRPEAVEFATVRHSGRGRPSHRGGYPLRVLPQGVLGVRTDTLLPPALNDMRPFSPSFPVIEGACFFR